MPDHMESTRLASGRLWHHNREGCTPPCPLHSPSDHSMIAFPLSWRSDRKIMERICTHGVGHPDPDDRKVQEDPWQSIHGCDGCCREVEYGVPPVSEPVRKPWHAVWLTRVREWLHRG